MKSFLVVGYLTVLVYAFVLVFFISEEASDGSLVWRHVVCLVEYFPLYTLSGCSCCSKCFLFLSLLINAQA